MNAVKSINTNISIPCTPCKKIPALFEDLNTIRFNFKRRRSLSMKALICNCQCVIISHCLNYRSKESLSRRDLFKQNPLLHMMALIYEIINGKCIDKPCSNSAFFNVFTISYFIDFPSRAITYNINIKEFFNGIFVPMESSLWYLILIIIVERTTRPTPVDFLPSNTFGTKD